jgi:hypothetical protein
VASSPRSAFWETSPSNMQERRSNSIRNPASLRTLRRLTACSVTAHALVGSFQPEQQRHSGRICSINAAVSAKGIHNTGSYWPVVAPSSLQAILIIGAPGPTQKHRFLDDGGKRCLSFWGKFRLDNCSGTPSAYLPTQPPSTYRD